MDDGEELRECGVSLVRLEDMKKVGGSRRGSLEQEEAMQVRDWQDHLNFDLDHFDHTLSIGL